VRGLSSIARADINTVESARLIIPAKNLIAAVLLPSFGTHGCVR
jgi:hypothetical protein